MWRASDMVRLILEWENANVKAGIATSRSTIVTCGVPQGSGLGPVSFTIYKYVELGKVIRKYGLEYLMYADGTHLYLCFNTRDTACAIAIVKLNQHRAARLITHTKKHDHITHVMRSFHWLSVRAKFCF